MAVTFHAMGTTVTVLLPDATEVVEGDAARRVEALFAEAEQTFSRFRATSELSRVLHAGGSVACSRDFVDALLRCQSYARRTGGLFDPGVGAAVVAAGYDRSFAPGALDRSDGTPPAPTRCGSVCDVRIDAARGVVEVPTGLALDLGGIVKGMTVDRASAALPVVAAVDAGGDAWLRGDGPDGDGWLVDVEDPLDDARVLCTLRVRDRAVATSGANRRRWRLGDASMHHLIDPRTGSPSSSGLRQATVVAATAEEADVLAKCLFLLGRDAAPGWLATWPGTAAVLVADDGRVSVAGSVDLVAG